MLDLGEDGWRICAPAADPPEPVVFGQNLLRHLGESPIVIIDVGLVDPIDLELVEVALMRREHIQGPTVGLDYLSNMDQYAGWDRRIQAVGATIAAGDEFNIVVIVEAGPSELASARTRIAYVAERGHQSWQDVPVEMLVSRLPCEVVLEGSSGPPTWPISISAQVVSVGTLGGTAH